MQNRLAKTAIHDVSQMFTTFFFKTSLTLLQNHNETNGQGQLTRGSHGLINVSAVARLESLTVRFRVVPWSPGLRPVEIYRAAVTTGFYS